MLPKVLNIYMYIYIYIYLFIYFTKEYMLLLLLSCQVTSDSFETSWTGASSRLLCPWDFPGKKTRVGCHFLLQGIFLTEGLNLCFLHCMQILYC